MGKKIFLKPQNEESIKSILKNPVLKDLKEIDSGLSTMACIYCDTPEMDLLKNDFVLFMHPGDGGVLQTVIGENNACNVQYEETAALPDNNADAGLFSKNVGAQFEKILNKKQLLAQYAILFEIKTSSITVADKQKIQLKICITRFEDNEIKGELCTVELENNGLPEADFDTFCKTLCVKAGLAPCPSHFMEALRVTVSGFYPTINYKKYKKHNQGSGLEKLFTVQMHKLINSYAITLRNGAEKESVHQLRLQLRRMFALLEAFKGNMPDEAQKYIDLLESLLNKTGVIRNLDVLQQDIYEITEMESSLEISYVLDKLSNEREAAAKEFLDESKNSRYAQELNALWCMIARKFEGWKDRRTEEADLNAVLAYTKILAAGLGELKKPGFNDLQTLHDARIRVKMIRCLLESLADELPKGINEYIDMLEKIQDALGIITDSNENLQLLKSMAAASANSSVTYACGICAGILFMFMHDIKKEIYAIWKQYKPSLIKMNDLL